MRILCEKNGKRLQVHTIYNMYSITVYKNFNTIQELTDWLSDEGWISNKKNNRTEYEFYYSCID